MNRRAPVLGTRDDLVSPHGQYTAELLDERGKVVHRVVVENAILDVAKRGMDQAVRNQYSAMNNTAVLGTDTDQWWMQLAKTPKEGPLIQGMEWWHRWLYLSDSTQAINAGEWAIPGTILGAGFTVQNGGTIGTKRGAYNQAQSLRDRNTRRTVVDFTAAQAIGTIGSFGLGNILSDYSSGSAQYPTPCYIPQYRGGHPGVAGVTAIPQSTPSLNEGISQENIPYTGAPVSMSAHFLDPVAGSELWYALGGQGIFNRNIGLSGVRPASQPVTITGPTYTTIGATISQNIGLCTIGVNMWLGYATTLKKCAIPTGSSLSVTNTYAAVTGFTDSAIIDLTTDGTSLYLLGSTKVFVVDPATGAVTSSWAHGITGASGLQYSSQPVGYLYLSSAISNGNSLLWNNGAGTSSMLLRVNSFTTAGVAGPYTWANPAVDTYGAFGAGWSGWTGSFNGGWGGISFSARGASGSTQAGVFRGPQAASRALLATPLVKDATKSLRVIYDITFT